MPPRKQLGQILVEAGLLDEFQLKSALGYQKKWGGRLGKVLVENRFVTEQALVQALHEQTGVAVVDLAGLTIPDYLLRLVPLELASRHNLVPVRLEGEPGSSTELLLLAMDDPTNLEALDEVRFRTGKRTAPVLAGESAIQAAIKRWYLKEEPVDLAEQAGSAASASLEAEQLVVVQGKLEAPPAETATGDFDPDDPFAQLESLALDPGDQPAGPTAAGGSPAASPLSPHPAQTSLDDIPETTPAAPATPVMPVAEGAEDLPEVEIIDVAEPEQLPDSPPTVGAEAAAEVLPGPQQAPPPAPTPPPIREVPGPGPVPASPSMEQLLSRVGLAGERQADGPVPGDEPGQPVAAPPPVPEAGAGAPETATSPPLPTPGEVQQLLEKLEGAESVDELPRILKPSNVVAALVRLLLDKQVFSESELLEELNRQ